MILLAFSGVVAVLSIIGWAATDADYNTCRNALVGAFEPGPCTQATFWHDISSWGLVLAIVLCGLGIWDIRRTINGKDRDAGS